MNIFRNEMLAVILFPDRDLVSWPVDCVERAIVPSIGVQNVFLHRWIGGNLSDCIAVVGGNCSFWSVELYFASSYLRSYFCILTRLVFVYTCELVGIDIKLSRERQVGVFGVSILVSGDMLKRGLFRK